jgi:predicted RNA-binding protein with PUA-like domain
MMAMKKGDEAFFYHSNEGKAIVGVVEVIREAYLDPENGPKDPWVLVDVRAVAPFPKPVTLADAKAETSLAKMSLVASFRLSVQPVTAAEWAKVCLMGGYRAP